MTSAPPISVSADLEQRAFRALLDAMSRPGRICGLPPGRDEDGDWSGLLTIARTLLDHEVTFHAATAGDAIAEQIRRRTGSRSQPLASADYVFADADHAVRAVRDAREGALEEPERTATIVVRCHEVGAGDLALMLTGPGIDGDATLRLADVSVAAIEAREARNWPYPGGPDLVFVDGRGRVACIPRSTAIQFDSRQEGEA